MALRLQLLGYQPERYLKYAKRRLLLLKKRRQQSDTHTIRQNILVTDSSRIYLQAGPTDLIRIIGASRAFPSAWLDIPQESDSYIAVRSLWLVFPFRSGGSTSQCYLSNFRLSTNEEGGNIESRGDLPNLGNTLRFDKIPYTGSQAYALDAFCLAPDVNGSPPPGVIEGGFVPSPSTVDSMFRAFHAIYQNGLDDLCGFRDEDSWLHWLFNRLNYTEKGDQWSVPSWVNREIAMKVPQSISNCLEINVYLSWAKTLCSAEPVLDDDGIVIDYHLLFSMDEIWAGYNSGKALNSAPTYGPNCEHAGQQIYVTVGLRDYLAAPIYEADHPDIIRPMRDLSLVATVIDARSQVGAELGVSGDRIFGGGNYSWAYSYGRIVSEQGWRTHGYFKEEDESCNLTETSSPIRDWDLVSQWGTRLATNDGLPAVITAVTYTGLFNQQTIDTDSFDGVNAFGEFIPGHCFIVLTSGPNAGQARVVNRILSEGFQLTRFEQFVPEPTIGTTFEYLFGAFGQLDYFRDLLYGRDGPANTEENYEIWQHAAEFHTHGMMARTLRDGIFSAHAVTTTGSETLRPNYRWGYCVVPYNPLEEGIFTFYQEGSGAGTAIVKYLNTKLVDGQLSQTAFAPNAISFNDQHCWQEGSSTDQGIEVVTNRGERIETLPPATLTSYHLGVDGQLAPLVSVSVPTVQYQAGVGDPDEAPVQICNIVNGTITPGDFNPTPYVNQHVTWLPNLAFAEWEGSYSDNNYRSRWPINALSFSNNNRLDIISKVGFVQTFGPDGEGNVYINGELLFVAQETYFGGTTESNWLSNVQSQANTHFAASKTWNVSGRTENTEDTFDTKVGASLVSTRHQYLPPTDWKGHMQMKSWSQPFRVLPRSFGSRYSFRFIIWPEAQPDAWGFCVFVYEDAVSASTAWQDLIALINDPESTTEQIATARQTLRSLRILIANNFASDDLMDAIDPRDDISWHRQTVWINTIWQP